MDNINQSVANMTTFICSILHHKAQVELVVSQSIRQINKSIITPLQAPGRQRPAPSFANEWLRCPSAARFPASFPAPTKPSRIDSQRYEPLRRRGRICETVPFESTASVGLRTAQMSRIWHRPSKNLNCSAKTDSLR